jgi:hypothetical protein
VSLPFDSVHAAVDPSTMTPGALLAHKQTQAMTPGHHGLSWEVLSEVLEDVAWAKCRLAYLRVHCMPGGGSADAPGYYQPQRKLVGLEGGILPCAPDLLDLSLPDHFEALANLYGIYLHECGHAVHTKFLPATLPTSMQDVAREMVLLEEPRMEAAVVRDTARDAIWLRASSLQLDVGQSERVQAAAGYEVREAIWKCILVEGRVMADVLSADDARPFSQAVEKVLGQPAHAKLLDIIQSAVQLNDGDLKGLEAQARRLRELVPPDPERCGLTLTSSQVRELIVQSSQTLAQASAKAAMQLHDGSQGGKLQSLMSTFAGAHAKALSQMEPSAPQPPAPSSTAETAQESSPDPFTQAGQPSLGKIRYTPRRPTRQEGLLSRRLAARIRKARWRGRGKTRIDSVLPPGKLRPRRALQAKAQQALGLVPQSAIWQQTRHRQTEKPYPRCAILVDTSWSMKSSAPIVSSCLWVISQAIHAENGRTLGIAFGDDLALVAPPGRPSPHVLEFEANGGTGFVAGALQIAYDRLELGNARKGPRVVVIVSDGDWTDKPEVTRKLKWLKELGVRILLVDHGKLPPAEPCSARLNVRDAPDLAGSLGKLIVQALEAG